MKIINTDNHIYLWGYHFNKGTGSGAQSIIKRNPRKVERKEPPSEHNDQAGNGNFYKGSRGDGCYTASGKRKTDKVVCRTLGKV